MIIHSISDLHLESRDYVKFANTLTGEADALILAGDIYSLRHLDQALKVYKALCEKYNKVFYVPGNHEYYKTNVKDATNVLHELQSQIPNMVVLESGKVHVWKQKRFLGDTMWFKNDPFNQLFERHINDFAMIKGFSPWVYERNSAFRAFMNEQLKEGDIVITHHIPHPLCISEEFTNNDLNRFFLCDMSNLISDRAVGTWFFGHTHDAVDISLDNTRLFCNPLGYKRENRNPNFYKRMEIEIK